MSLEGAPSQTSLWSWLEKDLTNKNLIQEYMSKSEVILNQPKKRNSKEKTPSTKNRHRKMKKKKKQNTSKKVEFNQTKQRSRISDYLQIPTNMASQLEKKDTSDQYGDNYTSKSDGTIRIWFTNPCGIGVRAYEQKSHESFAFLKNRSRCDIFGFAETNVNWHKLSGSSTFYSRVKSSWREFKTITCHNTHQDLGIHQRGGCCMAVMDQVSHRMNKSGRDGRKLGRWAWMEFSGRNGFSTRVYTAYRPASSKPHDSKNTTVFDQQASYIRSNKLKSTPRELFDDDLKNELLQSLQYHNIILMLDANEDVEDSAFNNMMNGIGLINGIRKRNLLPMPPTHHRGSRPISTFYCSRNIQVKRSGVLPIAVGVSGDHRNIFLDVETKSFLGGKMYMVLPPQMKRLKLDDSRVYNLFIKHAKKHLVNNNQLALSSKLIEIATYPPSENMICAMEKLDEQMGRAITCGLKKCRKFRTGTIKYSALFKNLSMTHRLWLLVLKKQKGQRISNTTIRKLAKKLLIENPLSLPMQIVIKNLREAKSTYEKFIPHAQTERQKFYEELASANATVQNKKKESILKQIMQTESSRDQHSQVRRYFPNKNSNSKKVDRVQIMRDGKWEEISTPRNLIQALQEENKEKYSCTNDTPLMGTRTHQQMGNFAEGRLAKDILYGHVQPNKLFDPWTSEMLEECKLDANIPTIPVMLSESEVKDTWRLSKEKKASSPSGRYNATYKAFCMDDKLTSILTNMMNIPFKLGHPYSRWSTFLDIMAFKKANSTRINTLRSIIISEGDWNAAGRIYVTQKMMQQAESMSLLPEEHLGGRKGRKSIEGAITKRLFLDNSRITQKPVIILSTDAANCYDRMVHKFICMMCRKWGLQEQVLKALLQPLQNARHFTRTAYGDSFQSFTGSNLQGAGQGNTGAAPFWTCVSTAMINILKRHQLNSKWKCPISLETVILTLMAFVDDTEIFLSTKDDDLNALLDLAQETISTWKSVLQASGGDMRSKKCAWILLHYSNDPSIKKNMKLKTISIQDEDGIVRKVQRYEEKDSREYLGVHQQADGGNQKQIEILFTKVENWNEKIKASRLPPTLNYIAVFSRIHKSLLYPLPATTIDEDTLQDISNKLYEQSLPKCGINRKFPIDFRDLPHQYHGLGLPNLYLQQEISKLNEFISKSHTEHIMWKQLQVGLELAQMQTGLLGCVYNYNYGKYEFLLQDSWIKTQWKFISDMGLNVKGWKNNIPLQRIQDKGIMETMVNSDLPQSTIENVNKCRKYLKAFTLSDIIDGSGRKLCPMALKGVIDPGRESVYEWKSIKKPNLYAWTQWECTLKKVLCEDNQSSTVKQNLGNWTHKDDHKWYWFYHPYLKKLFHLKNEVVHVYRLSSRRSMDLRNNVRLFRAIKVIKVDQIPLGVCRATAEYESNKNYSYAKFYGYSHEERNESPTINDTILTKFNPNQQWMIMSNNISAVSNATLCHMMSQKVVLVSDGSHKDEDSSMAAILESEDRSTQIIISGPVPSNFSSPSHCTDSYRSEMAGLLAGLTLFKYMEQVTQMSTHITISCDNDAALDVGTIYSYFSANMKHYDMARALINARLALTSTTSPKRVLGHADAKFSKKSKNRTEVLNQSCDRLAKKARVVFPAIGPVDIKGEGITLWHEGAKIYNEFNQHLQHIYYVKIAKKRLSQKYAWRNEEFEKIDWKANKRALGLLSNPTKIWISKYIAKFLPIGRNMQRIGNWSEDHCPRCRLCEETHHHMLRCQHEGSQLKLVEGIGKLRDWMGKMKTPQQLADQIVAKIKKELQMPHTSFLLPHPLIQEQQKIGNWFHFMEGRISKQFRRHLDEHYLQSNENKTGEMWVSGIIQRIWTLFYRPIWEMRNNCVHRKNNTLHQTREREDLQTRVQKLYTSNTPDDFLSQDKHLFDKKLETLLQSSNMALKAWLYAIGIAQQARDRAQEVDKEDASQTLHKWLLPPERILVRRPARTPPKKKRVSTKVRKQLKKTYILIKGKERVRSKKRKQLAASFIRNVRPLRTASSLRNEKVDKEFLRRTGSFRPP